MNREALMKLDEILSASYLPVDFFDMGDWYQSWGECGTAACAAGCAALHPWFQERGLLLHDRTIAFENHDNIFACARFFDIPFTVAVGLFIGDSYYDFDSEHYRDVTPTVVCNRIRGLLSLSDDEVKALAEEPTRDVGRILFRLEQSVVPEPERAVEIAG